MCLCWLSGIGLAALIRTTNTCCAILPAGSASLHRSSFPSLIVVLTLPHILAELFFYFGKFSWLMPLIFLRAFLFGFIYFSIALIYKDASWIAHSLIMFADSIACILWLYFLLNHAEGKHSKSHIDFLFIALLSLIVGIIDYYLLTPFLTTLSAF